MSKPKKMKKMRNWYAVDAWEHTGAGPHGERDAYKRRKLTPREIEEMIEEDEDAIDSLDESVDTQ